ncbi:helix-turn-helix transcriptional regulator [Actinomadura fulvescens]|uniref:Helix-turn-helix transcriptional regulator n=2 Tax=Actinomadura fulvescens TaxID=46160 RepID=A0ABP6CM76_9ACTN
MKEQRGHGRTARQELAAEFRRLREESARSVGEAAVHLDQPPSLVVRLETGTAALRRAHAIGLLDLYGIQGAPRSSFLARVDAMRSRNWWYPYGDLVTGDVEQMLILEDEADLIQTHQPSLIPGLLQTERYAWELMQIAGDIPLDAVEQRLRLRMARQRVVADENGPVLRVVLDEAALRRPVGTAAVMRDQYERLLEVTETDRLSVRVVPLSAGLHRAVGFAFHIFESAGREPAAVQIEMLDRVRFAEDQAEIASYIRAFAAAGACAMSAERSRSFLLDLLKRC